MPISPDTPPSIIPGSGRDILDEALRRRLVTETQVAECRRVHQAMQGMGIAPKPLDQIAREKGFLQAEEVDRIRARRPAPKRGEVEVPGYLIHGLLERTDREATYQALRETTGERCVLRILGEDPGPDGARDFREEAQRLIRVSHPNLLSGIDAGLDRTPCFVAIEMAAGEVLQRVIDEKGPLPEADAVRVAWDVARALEAIHKAGLVHGEIHPRRILIPRAGGAKLTPIRPISEPLPGAETISPERVLADRTPGAPSDLYSLGATLFLMITGRPPFQGKTPEEVMAKHLVQPAPSLRDLSARISEATEAITARLLAKDPGDRYPSASALLPVLEDVLRPAQGRPAAAVRPAPGARPPVRVDPPSGGAGPPGEERPPPTAAKPSPPPAVPAPRRAPSASAPLSPPAGRHWSVAVLPIVMGVLLMVIAAALLWDSGGSKQTLPIRTTRRRTPPVRPPPGDRPDRRGAAVKKEREDHAPRVPRNYEATEPEEIAGPEAPEVQEVPVPRAARLEPPTAAEIREFLKDFVSAMEGYKFDEAAEICKRGMDRPALADLAGTALHGLGAVQEVMARARGGARRWEGEKRSIRLRDGQVREGTVRAVSKGLLRLQIKEGEIGIPLRLLSAKDLLSLAGARDPLSTGLVHLLLYQDAVRAEEALRSMSKESLEPYRQMLDTLAYQSLLERADVAYGRRDWRKALEAYLDLLQRFPDPAAFAEDRERVLGRVRNGLVLSRIAGSFHTEVEVIRGGLSVQYRLRSPLEWQDWTGEADRDLLDDTPAKITWKGVVTGDLVVQWTLEDSGGECWLEILADPEGSRGYRIETAEGGWRIQKLSPGGQPEILGEAAPGDGRRRSRKVSIRVERSGADIVITSDGETDPILEATDGTHREGTVRLGGDLSRFLMIRITGRLAPR